MAGQDVQHIDQPGGEGAEALRAGAEGRAARSARGAGQFGREALNEAGRHAAAQGWACRREALHCIFQKGESVNEGGSGASCHQVLRKQVVQHARQQERIGSGADDTVFIGKRGRLAAARVDHDQAPATGLHRPGLAAEVGHGPHAAVAGHGVGAQHQQPAYTCFG